MNRRLFIKIYLALLLAILSGVANAECERFADNWEKFRKIYIQDDGRVIDHGFEGISTSEGQAYALFFSLVADDKETYRKILQWTINNLARGDLKTYLPGWKWGRAVDGWHMLDKNSASDADLWLAYSLFQAAEKWRIAEYAKYANYVISNIKNRELVFLPKIGRYILPAPYGFQTESEKWKLNPSYTPPQLLTYFKSIDSDNVWVEIINNYLIMISQVSKSGIIPDWVSYDPQNGFFPDHEKGLYSSYESIRVYLWFGMLNKQDKLFDKLVPFLRNEAYAKGVSIPELLSVHDGVGSGNAPVGFYYALYPYQKTVYNFPVKIEKDYSRINLEEGYYNSVLKMFSIGWLENVYSFSPSGDLNIGGNKCLN